MNCKYYCTLIIRFVVLSTFLLTPWQLVRAAEKAVQAPLGKTLTPTDKPDKKNHETKRIIYKPPSRGAPAARVGAGTRGDEGTEPELHVLTPDHAGNSSSSQPVLYWYLSKTMSARLELALINDLDIEPVLETTLDREVQSGINRINLADYGVTLKPGVVYQWSIALVTDPGQRSRDRIASGRVKYVPLSDAQKATLATASQQEAMAFFAHAGYWYDLYDRISYLITAQPDNQNLAGQRLSLLEQVGLGDLAEK